MEIEVPIKRFDQEKKRNNAKIDISLQNANVF